MSEVALSLVLLVGAGLMIRSFAKLNRVDTGFDPERVLALGVALLPNKYPSDEQVATFYSQIIENVAAMPGVESVGAITDLPLSGNNTSDFRSEERRAGRECRING